MVSSCKNRGDKVVIDLFAGCGGLSLGLYQAGWKGLFAIEKNAFAFETLKFNLIDNKKHFDWPQWLPQKEHDINEVLANYSKQLKSLRGKVDLVAGGPPCQGFSMAGKRVEDDVRDNKDIYFIGDSKYYKDTSVYGENSIYKQFTYAKNVIQYNINVFNNKDDDKGCRYRDPLTEGYNITPNFFIRGKIDFNNPKNCDEKLIKEKVFERHNEHFFNRLFDRDTLFLQSYDINFMYVVTSYVKNSNNAGVKKRLQKMFRNDFMTFIEGRFEFSVLEAKQGKLKEAVDKNFRKLNGKVYKPSDTDDLIILALDKDKKYQFENLKLLSEIEDDFYVYDYSLGSNPNDIKTQSNYQILDAPIHIAAESFEVSDRDKTSENVKNYKRYKQASVLFGIYKDEVHLGWINTNRKYNVRLGERAGAVKRTSQVSSAEYLVLYEFQNETNYKVYKLSNVHHIWDAIKMQETGYNIKNKGENKKYYIYNLLEEVSEDVFGTFDIKSILEHKRNEIESNTKQSLAEGAPIYVYESDLKMWDFPKK